MLLTVVYCLFCLTILQNVQFVAMNRVHKLVTFNSGLVNFIPKVDERAKALPKVLSTSEADVICLQEVFSGQHIRRITEALKTKYPYSFSNLHGDNTQLNRFVNLVAASPCKGTSTYLALLCVALKCDLQPESKEKILDCAHLKCNALLLTSQECSTCIGVNGPSIRKVLMNCMLFSSPAFNLPGLLLLSKTPLKNNVLKNFNPAIRGIPRFYMTSDVDNVGTVLCTHMTTDTKAKYFETKEQYMFNSWAERNLFEARAISSIARGKEQIILLGDINAGPSIPSLGIESVFNESYKELIESGLESPYVSTVGKPTLQSQPIIIDHVMHKGFTAVAANRVFSNFKVEGSYISDHFGVEVWLSSK